MTDVVFRKTTIVMTTSAQPSTTDAPSPINSNTVFTMMNNGFGEHSITTRNSSLGFKFTIECRTLRLRISTKVSTEDGVVHICTTIEFSKPDRRIAENILNLVEERTDDTIISNPRPNSPVTPYFINDQN